MKISQPSALPRLLAANLLALLVIASPLAAQQSSSAKPSGEPSAAPATEASAVQGSPAPAASDLFPEGDPATFLAEAPSGGFVNVLGMVMVRIPAADKEGEDAGQGGYWVSRCEVTQGDYEKVREKFAELIQGQDIAGMTEDRSRGERGEDYPVNNVSWQDAVKFCITLTGLERGSAGNMPPGGDYEYMLPSVAQWLYFSRDALAEGALNSLVEARASPGPVGSADDMNPFGLRDLLGNVSEWCVDLYAPSLNGDSGLPEQLPLVFGEKKGARAVVGPDFTLDHQDGPLHLAATVRRAPPGSPREAGNVGFRVVLQKTASGPAGGN